MIWDIIHREMVSQIVSQVQIAAEKTRIMTQTRPQWQFFVHKHKCRLPVFVSTQANWCLKKCCHCETSPQTGRGNPPVEWNRVTITTKNRGDSQFSGYFSVHFPSNRGIATTSVRTGLAMTGNFEAKRQTPISLSAAVGSQESPPAVSAPGGSVGSAFQGLVVGIVDGIPFGKAR